MWLKVKRGLRNGTQKQAVQQQLYIAQESLQVPNASMGSCPLSSISSEDSALQPQPKRLREWRSSLSTFLTRRRTGSAHPRPVSTMTSCPLSGDEQSSDDRLAAPASEPLRSSWPPHASISTKVAIDQDDGVGKNPRPLSSITAQNSSRNIKGLKVRSLCLEQEVLHRGATARHTQTSHNSLPTTASLNSLTSLEKFRLNPEDIRANTPATICEVLEASRASSNLERDELYTRPVDVILDNNIARSHCRAKSKASPWRNTYCQAQRSSSFPGPIFNPGCKLADYGLHRSPSPSRQIADFGLYGHRRITSA